jgi:signal transduction histidine kinase
MTTPTGEAAATSLAAAAPQLLDSLLYAVSHDLRSPLLSVSLSAQLLDHQLGDAATDGTREALGALQAAAGDLERMLAALNALSRAARRQAEPTEVALSDLLHAAPAATTVLDDLTAADLRTAMPDVAFATIEGATAALRWPLDGADGSPLQALAGSLHVHAGTPIEALACLQITLERHGASLAADGGEVTVRLPLTGAAG